MKNRKTKSIIIAAVLMAVLTLTGFTHAQAAGTGKVSAQASGDALTVGICILSTANQNLSKLDACGDDMVCRSAIILDTLLDIVVCTNPDDPNLALYACISDAVVDIAEIKSACGDDRACALQKLIPVILNLTSCFGE